MSRRIVKWLLWCLAVLAFILILGAIALWMMPRAVSTDWAKKQIETQASRALHAPVTVDGLQWTWKEGIHIQGLRIADDKAFGVDPIISLDRFLLKIDPAQLIGRRLSLDVDIEGLKAHVIRTADGRTNLEAWLARLSPPGKPEEQTQAPKPGDWRDMALALPGDLTARIRLRKGTVWVEDRQADQSLAIYDVSLLVDVPSLVHKPINISLRSEQEMDGNPLPPVDLTLSVKNLVDTTPAIQLKTLSVDAHCTLPGLDLSLSGGLSDMGIDGRVDLDLATLTAAAGPLLPPGLPTVSGVIGWVVQAQMGSEEEIVYDTMFSGERIMVSGGPLKEQEIGPVAFKFAQTGSVAPERQALTIAKGDLRLQNNTRMGWEGRIHPADASGIEADLSLADIVLDLKEMAGLARPFLPLDITAGWLPERPQGISVEQVHLNGILPAGTAHVVAKGLTMDLPGLELARAKDDLSAEGIHLRVSEADIRLRNRFPTSLDVMADLYMQGFSLSGDQPIHARGLKVADIHMTAKDLVQSPKGLLGLAGTVNVTESMTIEELDVPGLAAIPHIRHDLDASALMQDQPPLIKLTAETVVESPSPQIDALSKGPLKGGIRLEAQVADLDIEALTPIKANVGRLEGTIRLGDALDVQITGEAAALGQTSINLNGHAKIDLNSAATLIPAAIEPKGRFAGIVETDWRFKGRRPTPGEQGNLFDRKLSLAERLNALGFINTAELNADLRGVGLDRPMNEGKSLSVHGIDSVSSLSVTLSKGLRSVQLKGDLTVDRISELPGAPRFKPPLSAKLSYNVGQKDLSALQITETLRLDPLSINQDLHISVTKLDRLLNSKETPTLAALLRHLDVSVAAGLRTTLGPSLASLAPGLSLEGSLEAGLGLEFDGGKEMSARVSLESQRLDITADKVQIKGLTSHVHLSRVYSLLFEGNGEGRSGPAGVLLSQKVLRPSAAVRLPSSSGDPLARRLVEDLGGSLSGPPAFSFDAVHIRGGPFPLDLRHGEIRLQWAGSLPSLDRFQLDAMGGSILGDLRIIGQQDLYGLEMNGAFSGLDAATLLPKTAPAYPTLPQAPDQDTRISGQVSLKMPVSRDPVRVMNHLSAGLHLTHIGSRTLERLLYAMDPYETNEGIVKQRAILRKGTPEWVDLQIRHGNLALSGSVSAMGARIALPRVERLSLSNLPIHRRLEKILDRLGPVEEGLKTLSADSILIGKDSSIRFVDRW